MDKAILFYWMLVKYSSVQTECRDGLYWAMSQIGEGRPQWDAKWELWLKCRERTSPTQCTWPLLELQGSTMDQLCISSLWMDQGKGILIHESYTTWRATGGSRCWARHHQGRAFASHSCSVYSISYYDYPHFQPRTLRCISIPWDAGWKCRFMAPAHEILSQ